MTDFRIRFRAPAHLGVTRASSVTPPCPSVDAGMCLKSWLRYNLRRAKTADMADRDILPDCFQPVHYMLLIKNLDFEHWTYDGEVRSVPESKPLDSSTRSLLALPTDGSQASRAPSPARRLPSRSILSSSTSAPPASLSASRPPGQPGTPPTHPSSAPPSSSMRSPRQPRPRPQARARPSWPLPFVGG